MGMINIDDWLNEQEGLSPLRSMRPPAPQAPQPQPQPTPVPPGQPDPNIASPPGQEESPYDDPATPDMPDDAREEEPDFETWKRKFLVESAKGDVPTMKDLILGVRDRDLDPVQRKFVEDNLHILFLREHSNIDKACKEIRRRLNEELDHNNPATSLVNHMTAVLEEIPMLNNCFIKLTGMMGMKADLHRKFIAALTGSVQMGSGGKNADIVFEKKDYSMRVSTRFNARFGEVQLGEWSLHHDDPSRHLEPAELKRLEEGSPEERDVLRRRVVMESIAEAFRERAFVVNVVGTDGTIYTLGWDLSTSLRSAYTEGRLVVRTRNDKGEAMIDRDGEIVSLLDMKIMYKQKDADNPDGREVEFLHNRHGHLFLTAQLPTVKDASTAFGGIVLKETPWTGNPTDLRTLERCVPNASELLMRSC